MQPRTIQPRRVFLTPSNHQMSSVAQKRSFTSTSTGIRTSSTNIVKKQLIVHVDGTLETICKPDEMADSNTENIDPNIGTYVEDQQLFKAIEDKSPVEGQPFVQADEDPFIEDASQVSSFELQAPPPLMDDPDTYEPPMASSHNMNYIQQEFAKINLKLDALLKWTGKSGTMKFKYTLPIQTSEELLEWNADVADSDIFQSSVSL